MPAETETLNIVILGASFAGCAAAHHFLDRVLPTLCTIADGLEYRIVLISPSTHIYWNIAAPRILVSEKLIPYEDAFVAIEPGFERYGKNKFTFIQALATSLDTENQLITVEITGKDGYESVTASRRATMVSGKRISQGPQSPTSPKRHQKQASSGSSNSTRPIQTIPYHALILATGSSTFSPLFTLQGSHERTRIALDAAHRRIPSATNIVIAGGGPTGVETAGQLGTFFRSNLAFKCSRLSRREWKALGKTRQITLISATDGLLPSVDEALGRKAEKQLRGLGIKIIHNTRIVSAFTNDSSDPNYPPKGSNVRTTLTLSNGTTVSDVDLYIPCTGVRPNTAYLPPHFLSASGYANTDATPLTLRVVPRLPHPSSSSPPNHPLPRAERVYAVGDCASYSANYVLDVYDAIPVLMHNLTNDLLAWELRRAQPYGGNEDEIAALEASDAAFQGRRAKPPKKRDAKEETGRKKLQKRVARMTLMTPFPEFAGGKEGGEEKAKEKAVAFATGTDLNRVAEMSLSEAVQLTEPGATSGSPSLPSVAVDKSRWSGLSGKGKQKAEGGFGSSPASPQSAGMTQSDVDDFPLRASTAMTVGSGNDASLKSKKADGEEEEKEQHVYVDTQLCPITRFGGVGVVFGYRLPSLMVWALKGRDYRVAKGKAVVWNGNNPY